MRISFINRRIKPLGAEIDVFKCLRCGTSLAVNADAETFTTPAPLECKDCPGQPDMQVGRYVIKSSGI